MITETAPIALPALFADLALTDVAADAVDGAILTYIADTTLAVIRADTPQRVTYRTEPDGRSHRIVHNNPDVRSLHDLPFVGFISRKYTAPDTTIVARLSETDLALVGELAHMPGLLTYASLELPDGNWANLVTFAHSAAKSDVTASQHHEYATRILAPHYFEWVRVHHGSITESYAGHSLTFHTTKYYTFHPTAPRPTIRVQTYV